MLFTHNLIRRPSTPVRRANNAPFTRLLVDTRTKLDSNTHRSQPLERLIVHECAKSIEKMRARVQQRDRLAGRCVNGCNV